MNNSIICITDGTEMVKCIVLFHTEDKRKEIEAMLCRDYVDTPKVWNLIRSGNLYTLKSTPEECNYMSDYLDLFASDYHYGSSMSGHKDADNKHAYVSLVQKFMACMPEGCYHPQRWMPIECTIDEMVETFATNDPAGATDIYMHDDGFWHHMTLNELNQPNWEELTCQN